MEFIANIRIRRMQIYINPYLVSFHKKSIVMHFPLYESECSVCSPNDRKIDMVPIKITHCRGQEKLTLFVHTLPISFPFGLNWLQLTSLRYPVTYALFYFIILLGLCPCPKFWFQSFDFECTRWSLFQRRAMHSELDICGLYQYNL